MFLFCSLYFTSNIYLSAFLIQNAFPEAYKSVGNESENYLVNVNEKPIILEKDWEILFWFTRVLELQVCMISHFAVES